MQQTTPRIIVVSEGLVFEGIRTSCAFAWRETGAIPANRQPQAPKPPAVSVEYVQDWLRQANLSKDDKAKCRRQVAAMSASEVSQLMGLLRGYRKGGRL